MLSRELCGDDLKSSRARFIRRKRGADFGPLAVRGVAVLVLTAVCVLGIRWVSARVQASREQSSVTVVSSGSSTLEIARAPEIQSRNRRLVYPYSVIPGGVGSARELREATEHDPVVARHYSGFDYRRARIVRVNEPRKVYLSYRLGNQIYWTREQAFLRVGETLLTDGNTTTRTRCGNQVSVLPQARMSPKQPLMAELDRPDAVASGIESIPPTFNSGLLHIDPIMPMGPASSAAGNGFASNFPLGFIPLPFGGVGGGVGNNGGGGGQTPPPVVPPAATPEPGTMVLVLSGAVLIFARYRKS